MESVFNLCNSKRATRWLLLGTVLALANGCAVLSISDSLPRAILNQDDPQLIRDGAPAFLIMLDALVAAAPNDDDYLFLAARLYSAYSSAFLGNDAERGMRLSRRAMDYAKRGMCEYSEKLCVAIDAPYDVFLVALEGFSTQDDLNALFDLGSAWASWLRTHAHDWDAIAQLPKINALFSHIVTADDKFRDGEPHLYIGVLESQIPPALGGKPEKAKAHFERAIALSNHQNLVAKTLYAEQYARSIYDQELHDDLLRQVIATDPIVDMHTLSNVLAQEKARALLDESTTYFE